MKQNGLLILSVLFHFKKVPIYFQERLPCIIQTQLRLVSMRRSAKKKTAIQTVEGYAGSTSIHGISYIFDREGAKSFRFLLLHILSQGDHVGGPVLVDGGRS